MDSPATDAQHEPSGCVVPVACALIERDGRLLVAQRPPGKKRAGKWEFPGGKLEAGETADFALVREIREELGLDIQVGKRLAAVRHDYGDAVIELLPYRCALTSGEPHPHEHTAIRWCTREEIAALDLAEADRPVFDYWCACAD